MTDLKKINISEEFKKDIDKAVNILKNAKCGKIYIFGSLLNGNYSNESDIDLGIEDFPEQDFFKIYAKLNDELEHQVDLVDFSVSKDFFIMLSKIKEIIRVA